MELYKIGGLLLDISIGLLILEAIIRFCLAIKYFKRNGSRTLTGAQRATLGKFSRPAAIVGLVLAVASLVLLII